MALKSSSKSKSTKSGGTTSAQIKSYNAKNKAPSLKSQGAGYSTTNRKGETTYYKSSKDAPGYSDTFEGKGEMSKGTPLSRFDSTGKQLSTIPARMKPEVPVTVPQPQVDNIGDVVGSNNAGLAGVLKDTGVDYSSTTGFTSTPKTEGTQTQLFKGYQQLLEQTQGELGTGESRLRKLEKENQLRQKEQAVTDLTSQINQIVAKRDADMLRVEGQGRGIPEVIIGGQQAQIQKEAAISALPVQAQLAAAQGALELAQNHVDKMFQIQSQDALAKYNYKTKLIDSVYNFVTQQEQRRLDEIRRKEDRAYDMQKMNIAMKNDWAKTALEYGQSNLVGQIMKLDPNSPTFSQDLAGLQGKVQKPVSGTSTSYEIKTVNGKEVLFNPKTGEIKPINAPGGVASQQEYEAKKASIQDDINRASELLSNSLGIKSSAGTYQPGFFGSLFTGAGGVKPEDGLIRNLTKFVPVIGNFASASYASTQKDDFLSGVSYIVNNQTFDKLTNLKEGGATFGALSDSERVAIGRAATDLASSVEVDESGNITGFRGSEKKLVENLTKVLEGYKAAQDQLNIEYGVDPDERDEALLLWNRP